LKPQRAYFERLAPDGSSGYGLSARERLPVMFNPTDFTLVKSSQLAEVNMPGLDTPLQQFVRGQAEKLTVKLFFDATDERQDDLASGVVEQTDRFYSLVKIHPDLHAPPICRFVWGYKFPGSQVETGGSSDDTDATSLNRRSFTGVVESVQQEFSLFSPAGVALRATLTVTLREYKTLSLQQTQLRLLSRDRSRRHVVRRGETLSAIASRYYGSPADWRAIAVQNGITDPRTVRSGMVLDVPAIEGASV
jgi:LysM repeat protein